MGSGEGEKKGGPKERAKAAMGKEAAASPSETPQGLLEKLRPRRRIIFFIAFVGFCAWVMAFYDPCQVESKSRRDCGYSGISPGYCISGSCFTSRGGKLDKKVVKVERQKGEMLGLEFKSDKGKDPMVLVTSIGAGAVREYNSKLPSDSEDRIRVGDALAKVDGSSGKSLPDAISKSSAKSVEIEIRRSQLPSYLVWMRNSAKPGTVETVLTAPGFKRWSKLTSQLGAVGFGCWLLSGYGTASLPGWYFSLSAAVAFKLVRCCHDESVPGGIPHCFKSADEELQEVVNKAWKTSSEFALKLTKQWRSFAEEVLAATTGQKVQKASKKKKDEKK